MDGGQTVARCRGFENTLERDDFSSNRHPALSSCLSMISAQTLRVCREGKPVPTFPDHALGASQAHVLVDPCGRAGIDRSGIHHFAALEYRKSIRQAKHERQM